MNERYLEKILKALANRKRLAIITLLQSQGEQSVGEIARSIKLSFKSTSKHLLALTNGDIVDKEQRGKQVIYGLNPKAPEVVRHLLRIVTP